MTEVNISAQGTIAKETDFRFNKNVPDYANIASRINALPKAASPNPVHENRVEKVSQNLHVSNNTSQEFKVCSHFQKIRNYVFIR
jgi:hypothetical protein